MLLNMFAGMTRWLPERLLQRTRPQSDTATDSLEQLQRVVKEAFSHTIHHGAARFWWQPRLRCPWVIVTYEDSEDALTFVQSSATEFPVQRFAPRRPDPFSVILTKQGAVILWPAQLSIEDTHTQWLGHWLYKQRRYVATPWIIHLSDHATPQDYATKGFQCREQHIGWSHLLHDKPACALAVTGLAGSRLTLLPLSRFVMHTQSAKGWEAHDFENHIDELNSKLTDHYRHGLDQFNASEQYEQLAFHKPLNRLIEHLKITVRCLGDHSPYQIPVSVRLVCLTPLTGQDNQSWWSSHIWNDLQTAQTDRLLTEKLRRHGLAASLLMTTLGLLSWHCVSVQTKGLQDRLEALSLNGYQKRPPLHHASLRHSAALALWITGESPIQKADNGVSRYLRKLLLLDRLQEADDIIKSRAWLRIENALVQPLGTTLEASLKTSLEKNQRVVVEDSKVYESLKLYLLLSSRDPVDANYVMAKSPALWRQLIQQHNDGWTDDLRTYAQQMLDVFSHELQNPARPVYKGDASLVSSVREHLKTKASSMAWTDKIYEQIIDEANARYPAVTLGSIIGEQHKTWLAARLSVPGAYTGKAFDNFVMVAIKKAGAGQWNITDWVLGAAAVTPRPQDTPSGEKLERLLTERYQKDYEQTWLSFIQSVDWSNRQDPKQLATGLQSLGHGPSSPLSLLVVKAKQESRGQANWVPDSLVNPDNLSHYADTVRVLQGRWFDTGFPDKTPTDSKQLLAQVLQQGSPWNDLSQSIDQRLLKEANSHVRDIWRTLLLKPATLTLKLTAERAGHELNQLWQRDVFTVWQQLTTRYPFNEEGADLGLQDLQRFLQKRDGPLDRFVDQTLTPFLTQHQGRYVPKLWNGVGIEFNNELFLGLDRLTLLGNSHANGSGQTEFELKPQPTPGLTQIDLDIDGQRLSYRNDLQVWHGFRWPVESPQKTSSLSIKHINGHSQTPFAYQGRLSWLRCLSQAHIQRDSDRGALLTWNVPRKDGEPLSVSFYYQLKSGLDPLLIHNLNRQTLPSQIIRTPTAKEN